MRATPEVYQGKSFEWLYRIFKNDLGHWVAFRWRSETAVFVSQEWFVEDGFVKDRQLKSNDPRLARFDSAEECENELLMIFAANQLDS